MVGSANGSRLSDRSKSANGSGKLKLLCHSSQSSNFRLADDRNLIVKRHVDTTLGQFETRLARYHSTGFAPQSDITQLPPQFSTRLFVIFVMFDPSSFIVKMSALPCESPSKAIFFPSGE